MKYFFYFELSGLEDPTGKNRKIDNLQTEEASHLKDKERNRIVRREKIAVCRSRPIPDPIK